MPHSCCLLHGSELLWGIWASDHDMPPRALPLHPAANACKRVQPVRARLWALGAGPICRPAPCTFCLGVKIGMIWPPSSPGSLPRAGSKLCGRNPVPAAQPSRGRAGCPSGRWLGVVRGAVGEPGWLGAWPGPGGPRGLRAPAGPRSSAAVPSSSRPPHPSSAALIATSCKEKPQTPAPSVRRGCVWVLRGPGRPAQFSCSWGSCWALRPSSNAPSTATRRATGAATSASQVSGLAAERGRGCGHGGTGTRSWGGGCGCCGTSGLRGTGWATLRACG